nr:hypothetical protein [Tanacetum cinerariifolium]
RFLSSFLLDGYGIDACGLGLEALTGVIVGSEIGEPQVHFPPPEEGKKMEVEFKLRNPPSKHLVFEEPTLDRQRPDKLVVGNRGLVNRSLMEVVTPILILVWNEAVLIVSLKILIVGHRRKTRWSNMIRHHLRAITGD